MAEHLLWTYGRALLLAQQGAFARMMTLVPGCTPAYMAMVVCECGAPGVRDPRLLSLKYLLAGFSLLALDAPARPVGTPSPGGDRVEFGDGPSSTTTTTATTTGREQVPSPTHRAAR